jgi:HNH endonuclease
MAESRTCPHCSISFEPRRTNQFYCSRLCKDRAKSAEARARTTDSVCLVEGCERKSIGRRYCSMHYRRLRVDGALGSAEAVRGGRIGVAPCAIAGCDRKYYALGLCALHYNRRRLLGDAGPAGLLKAANGQGSYMTQDGYRFVVYQAGSPRGHRTKKVAEHRLVMQRMLGRELEPFESVHHKNGIRDDNDPTNLELWTRPQPYGQRPGDLVAWVVEHYRDLVVAELSARGRSVHDPAGEVRTEARPEA